MNTLLLAILFYAVIESNYSHLNCDSSVLYRSLNSRKLDRPKSGFGEIDHPLLIDCNEGFNFHQLNNFNTLHVYCENKQWKIKILPEWTDPNDIIDFTPVILTEKNPNDPADKFTCKPEPQNLQTCDLTKLNSRLLYTYGTTKLPVHEENYLTVKCMKSHAFLDIYCRNQTDPKLYYVKYGDNDFRLTNEIIEKACNSYCDIRRLNDYTKDRSHLNYDYLYDERKLIYLHGEIVEPNCKQGTEPEKVAGSEIMQSRCEYGLWVHHNTEFNIRACLPYCDTRNFFNSFKNRETVLLNEEHTLQCRDGKYFYKDISKDRVTVVCTGAGLFYAAIPNLLITPIDMECIKKPECRLKDLFLMLKRLNLLVVITGNPDQNKIALKCKTSYTPSVTDNVVWAKCRTSSRSWKIMAEKKIEGPLKDYCQKSACNGYDLVGKVDLEAETVMEYNISGLTVNYLRGY